MAQEGAIGGRVLGRQRGQRLVALDDRPEQQALGFPAIGTLRFGGFVPFEPGADCLIVVIGLQCAHRLRRAESAARAVDVMRHADAFPRHHGLRRRHHDQRTCPFGQFRVSSKERFDMTCTSHAESGNRAPPALAPGDAHGQIG
ncbi:tyrosine-based site-specific recombinase domain protein [Burkholderia pseudomallei]|nr:tyrosine-based site-specific recombinase domain protein [Burkholderia pseudomallei]